MPLDQTEAPPHLPFHPHLAATPAAFSHSPLWAISKIYPFSLPVLEFRVTLIVNLLHVNLQNSWVQHKDYRNAIASPQTQRKVPFRQHKRPWLQNCKWIAKKFGDLRRGRNRRTAEYEPWLVVEGEWHLMNLRLAWPHCESWPGTPHINNSVWDLWNSMAVKNLPMLLTK
jgi:hypothetical protein